MDKMLRNKRAIAFFILPELIVFFLIVVVSIGSSFFYSLHSWNGITDKIFVGLDNFKALFINNQDGFIPAMLHSFILALMSSIFQLIPATVLAIIIARGIKGAKFFRVAIFIPVLFSSVVMGQLWTMIYNPNYGLLNEVLINLGILDKGIAWLGNKNTALICTFISIMWKDIGYYMLIMYASVKRIPGDIYEAAEIDGASGVKVATQIILPLIRPTIKTVLIIMVTGALKCFDIIYVLTNGGPDHATEVTSTLMYTTIFSKNQYGYGSSMAITIVLMSLLATVLINIWKPKEYTL